MEKVGQANAELSLAEEKEWKVEESSRLATTKEEVKAKLKIGALNTTMEFALRF